MVLVDRLLNPTASGVTVTTGSNLIVEANVNRHYVQVHNRGGSYVFLGYGVDAVIDAGIAIPPHCTWEETYPSCFNGDIYGICTHGECIVSIMETE